uniref:AAA+ ATPase domain-containing protein n=1 Tax=viral metagenome TaxID=1070528 RepID=A0A6C0E6M8_9ZZZZ
MEYKLFVDKFQPIYLNDFEMDHTLLTMLTTLIKMDNLNILFIGDNGSGKTSFLNAMIREYYKNYEYKEYEPNLLHINSLKEQGIHYYRNDVKTFCQTCSLIKNKKKVVLLDDIDVINEQSQQVFRNCIDKYKHNVHFISSCTNSQKVIESLQSRLIIIKIKPLQKENLVKIMDKICHSENINIHDDAKQFILNISNNTAKVLINYMEKLKLINRVVDLEIAMNLCTTISFQILQEYTELIRNGDINNAVQKMYSVYDQGYSVMDILDNYFLFVKTTETIDEIHKYPIISVLCKYITIFHNIHEDEIELALFTNNLFKILYSVK